MGVATELSFAGIRGYRYRMPLKRPYGTARGVTTAATNFVIAIAAERSGSGVEGIGECQPRHALTGDGDRRGEAAWEFLNAAAHQLHGRSISVVDSGHAVASIREIMTELDGLARQHASDSNRDRPFRGTLLGIEVAMLDATARALNLQVSELLGKKRDTIGISISTISSKVTLDAVGDTVIRQKRFPMTRVKGVGDLDHDWQLLEAVAQANRSVGREKSLWMDINEALALDTARTFVDGIVERMSAGVLTGAVVLEGILPKAQVTELPLLQRHADEACQAASSEAELDLRIMPDEGMWDTSDLVRVNAAGGCRALNIKAPKAGGLLASLDLAEAAVAADPDIHVSIGGMLGTSDITAWSLHNLARALPRVDYLTTVPPSNVEARISEPLARYRERGSNIIADQTTPGVGTRLAMDKLAPYIDRRFDTSTAGLGVTLADNQPADTTNAENTESGNVLGGLSGRELESYLLEREALALGLCCLRLGGTTFLAGPSSETVGQVGFHRTASTRTSRVARDILADRRYLGAVLRDEGVPFGARGVGSRFHAFVLDGTTVALVRHESGVSHAVLDEAHPEVLDLAIRALHAIPGLGHADVELAVNNHRSPLYGQEAHVVNMDSAPRLTLYEPDAVRPSGVLAAALVRAHAGSAHAPVPTTERVAARVSLIGSATKHSKELLEKLSSGLTLTVRETRIGDDDQVFAIVEGNLDEVAALPVVTVTGPDAPEAVELIPIAGAEDERPEVE